jgi:hypothetical protein
VREVQTEEEDGQHLEVLNEHLEEELSGNITSRSSNVREVQTEEEDGQHLQNEDLETGLLRICVSWVSGMETVRESGIIADIAEQCGRAVS